MKQSNLEDRLKNLGKTLEGWVRRYWKPELAGWVFAYGSSYVTYKITKNEFAAAYASSIGETFGFYTTMYVQEFVKTYRAAKSRGTTYGYRSALKIFIGFLPEFLHAELVDTLVTRPPIMRLSYHLLGREAGTPVGSLAADMVFFGLAGPAYELTKRFYHKQRKR